MDVFSAMPDFGLSWLDAGGPHADIVLSTRVRLARNLQGYPYASKARASDREAIFGAVERVAGMAVANNAMVLRMEDLDERTRRIFLERRLVSSDLAGQGRHGPGSGTAVVASPGEPVSIMVNEEDHLRLQSLVSGLRVTEAWDLVDRLDEEMGRDLLMAYHHEFGYLTSCPTNTGTGLRASALVHLPGLVLTMEMEKVLKGIGQVGLTFRGLYGEGSDVVGNFFQISNQTTLGKSEEDLVDHLGRIVATLIQKEKQARQVLMRDAGAVTEDKIWRAYGLLRYARSLTYKELMNLLSGVRLGVSLKLLPRPSVYTLNKIMIFSQVAHLDQAAGRELSKQARHAHRAEYVRAALSSENGPPTSGAGD